jgi:hypothetical protein
VAPCKQVLVFAVNAYLDGEVEEGFRVPVEQSLERADVVRGVAEQEQVREGVDEPALERAAVAEVELALSRRLVEGLHKGAHHARVWWVPTNGEPNGDESRLS